MKRFLGFGSASLVAVVLAMAPVTANANGNDMGPSKGEHQIIGKKLGWIVEGLKGTGYKITSIKAKARGRVRILAENDEHRREIICDGDTGFVRSDRVIAVFVRVLDGDGKGHDGHRRGGGHGGDSGDHHKSRDGSLLSLGVKGDVKVGVGGLRILGGGHSDDDCGCGGSDGEHGSDGGHKSGGGLVDSVTDSLGL